MLLSSMKQIKITKFADLTILKLVQNYWQKLNATIVQHFGECKCVGIFYIRSAFTL